jgi:DNA-directed RNA polymerase III subunit RPC5
MPRRRLRSRDTEQDSFQHQEKKPIEIIDDADNDEVVSSSGDETDEDQDDPVVKSYDVFMSNQLRDHIYLLQYPIRNPDEEYYDESAPYSARIKPNEGSFEIDVPIDNRNYNTLNGDRLRGPHSDGILKTELRIFDRQRLSGKVQSNHANYFVGVLNGGSCASEFHSADISEQLHLSPVKGTVQLRPSFNYYDAAVGGERRRKLQSDEGPAKQPRAVHVSLSSRYGPNRFRSRK